MSMINTNNTGNMSPFMALRKDDSTVTKQAEVLKDIKTHYDEITSNGGKTITKNDIKMYFETHPTNMTQTEMDQFLSAKTGSLGDLLFKGDDEASEKDLKGVNQNIRDHKILDLIYKNRTTLGGDDRIISKKDIKDFFQNEGQANLKEAGLTEDDIKDFVKHSSSKSGFFGLSRTPKNNIAGALFGKDDKASLSDVDEALEKVIKADGDFFADVF